MKTKLLLLALTLLLTGAVNTVIAQAKVTIEFYAINSKEGYDHVSRLQVFVDGKEVAVSPEKKQSEKNSVSINIKPGKHTIKGQLWANYPEEGWIERTLANDFSLDWMFEEEMTFKKGKKKLTVVFDVEKESVTVK